MLRKHMAACLMATALMASPALAQTNTAPAQQNASSAASGKFMTQQSANQWRASKLVGLTVYGANNERIGDINDVLVDRNGNAEAVVIGVGGFLGIGEKDVAVPFKSVEWKMTSDTNRTASNTGSAPANTTSGAANTNSGPGTGTTGTTASTAAPGTAGTTSSASNTTGSTAGTNANRTTNASDMNRGYPDHAVLHMTKADLQNAPTFRYAGSTDAGTSGSAPARTGTGMTAPSTANPPNAPRQ
jgi:sporulation protein YlmC with PRC-barrel domain